MKFKVIEIEFDFTGDDSSEEVLSAEKQNEICENVLSTVWEADNEDDLIEEITCTTGWCINSIYYVSLNLVETSPSLTYPCE